MKTKLLALTSVLFLGACQSMIVTENADGVVTKTPTSLVAVQQAQQGVNDCRIAVLQSQSNALAKIDGSTEAGRTQILMMSMLQKDQLAECDKVVTEVAAQFNATDRTRLQVIRAGIGVGGAVAGGYMLGQALEGVAAAGGTKINATNSNVTTFKGKVAVGGGSTNGGDLAGGGTSVDIGSGGNINQIDSATITGDKSIAVTSPAGDFTGRDVKMDLNQRLDISGTESAGNLAQ